MAKQSKSLKSTHVDPRMMVELAAKLEPEQVISERYGYNKHELQVLKTQPWFKKAYEEAKTMVESQFPFQKRMAVLAESLTLHLYEKTLETDSMPSKIEATKLFTKLADLEPKQTNPNSKEAFTITINLGDNPRGAPETLVVNHNPVPEPKNISTLNDDLFSELEFEIN